MVINSQAAPTLSCKEEKQRFEHAFFKGVEFTDRHIRRSHGNPETVVAPWSSTVRLESRVPFAKEKCMLRPVETRKLSGEVRRAAELRSEV
jgi:hypothetical protein